MKTLNSYVKKGIFYKAVVDDGSDIIFVIDYDGKILYHNKSVRETLGYQKNFLVGKNLFDFIHPAVLDQTLERFKECRVKPYCEGVESRFQCKDKTYVFLELNAINLKHKEGIKGLILDCRDITQRKKDAEELLRAQKARELFMANISHEIRTPINGISGMVTLLSDNPSTEDARTYLNAIKTASENLKVIINDILDLASIESGKLKFERIAFNLNDLIVSLIGSFKPQALSKNLELAYSISEDASRVFMGDPVRLNQILINLIGNALKFTHSGSINLFVSTHKTAGKEVTLQFDVTDTGIGIPKDKVKTIFESFSQADASVTRKYGGTGLGLTIVRQLVDLQKGWIKLKSEEGVGSTFSVFMPYELGRKEHGFKALGAPRSQPQTIDLTGYTILLVEDNDINQLYAGSLLKSAGCKVEVAENGLVALGKLKTVKIDLILMDIQMPVMDGFETTKRIRNDTGPNKALPIIALTANANDKFVDRCLAAGMNGYLSKPFNPEDLYALLKKHLSVHSGEVAETKISINPNKKYKYVNLSFLSRVSGNDTAFIQEMVGSFLTTVPSMVDGMEESVRQGDARKTAQLIHKIKPSLTMVGLTKTKLVADNLENELVEKGLKQKLKSAIAKFCKDVRMAIDELSTD